MAAIKKAESQQTTYHAVGKRKAAVARVFMKAGSGKINVNGKGMDTYFSRLSSRIVLQQPLELTKNGGKFDVNVNVFGSGLAAQADAIKYGISKCLLEFDSTLRKTLKKAGFLTRDARTVERKKYGLKGARARYQFSKR